MARMARKPKRLHQRPSRRMKGWKTVIATSLFVSFLLGKKNLKNRESWQIYNLVFISSCVRSRVRAGSIASASDTKPILDQQDQQAAKSRDHKILRPFIADERKGAGAATHFTQPWVNDDTWIYTYIYIYICICNGLAVSELNSSFSLLNSSTKRERESSTSVAKAPMAKPKRLHQRPSRQATECQANPKTLVPKDLLHQIFFRKSFNSFYISILERFYTHHYLYHSPSIAM